MAYLKLSEERERKKNEVEQCFDFEASAFFVALILFQFGFFAVHQMLHLLAVTGGMTQHIFTSQSFSNATLFLEKKEQDKITAHKF